MSARRDPSIFGAKPPHPATSVQRKQALGVPSRAPHPATVASRTPAFGSSTRLAPHAATSFRGNPRGGTLQRSTQEEAFSPLSLELADASKLAKHHASLLSWSQEQQKFVPLKQEFQFVDVDVSAIEEGLKKHVVFTLKSWIEEADGAAFVCAKEKTRRGAQMVATFRSSQHIVRQILDTVENNESDMGDHLVIAIDNRNLLRGFSVYQIDPDLEFMQKFKTPRKHFFYSAYRAADPETLFDTTTRKDGDLGGVGAALAIYHARVATHRECPIRAHATTASSAASYQRLGFADDTP